MKRGAVIAAAVLLAGCGFHPLYGVPDTPKGTMQATLRSIYVEPVPERLGYQLRNQLIDLLDGMGEPAGAAYRLSVTLTETSEAIGVQSQTAPGGITQTAITRYNDRLIANYELVDAKTNQVVTKGTETGLSSYNVLSSPYATLIGQQDADRRAAEDIADRIRVDIAVHFAQQAKR
ncbi:MAG TPA: LPS assembly lipoprotein LptE [Rhizomicrobium sp.]|nr:LPS assembly lipoprotein LptE [Rhizomicrobium sp.]